MSVQTVCADYLPHVQVGAPAEKTGMILKMDVSTLKVAAADIVQATRQDNLLAVVFQKTCMGRLTRTPMADLMPYYQRWTDLAVIMDDCWWDSVSLSQGSCAARC